MIPSTPQPAFEPRSTIIRASIPVSVPSLRAPTRRCVTCAEAGFVAWKSSLAREREADRPAERERRSRRERLHQRELAAERAAERLGDDANPLERKPERARELPPASRTSPACWWRRRACPIGSSHAVATCGSMYAW